MIEIYKRGEAFKGILRLSSIEDGMNVALAVESSAESEEMAHNKVVLSLMALQDSLDEIIEKENEYSQF